MRRFERNKKTVRAARLSAARLFALLVVLLCPLLFGCTGKARVERSFFAMDTYMTITAYGADAKVLQGAEEKVREIEELLSVTKENSEISILNREGRAHVSSGTAKLLEAAMVFSEMTQGALDPSVYPVTKLWGFTTGEYRVPSDDEIKEALQYVDLSQIRIEDRGEGEVYASVPKGAMIDLGAVAKGYTGTILRDYLTENGVESALLDLGGNIQAVGRKPGSSPFRIAVKDPAGDSYLGVLTLDLPDLAVVTSGAYERYFEKDGKRYGHIMDPKTGRPAESGLQSVTILHDNGILCDAFSTACFVLGEEKSIMLWRALGYYEFIMVTDDGRLLVSEGNAGRFTIDENCPYKLEIIRR